MTVTYLVDSDHNDRTIPAVGDWVRVKAREGTFVVLRLDMDAGTADLASCDRDPHADDPGVPLNLLSPATDYLPELFRWYVEDAPVRDAG